MRKAHRAAIPHGILRCPYTGITEARNLRCRMGAGGVRAKDTFGCLCHRTVTKNVNTKLRNFPRIFS